MRFQLAVWMVAGLLGAWMPAANAKPSPMNHPDSLNWQKGRVWTITVDFISKTSGLSKPKRLLPWNNQQDFYDQVDDASKQEDGLVKRLKVVADSVRKQFAPKQNVSPEQLVAAVVGVLSRNNQLGLEKQPIDSLQKNLNQIPGLVRPKTQNTTAMKNEENEAPPRADGPGPPPAELPNRASEKPGDQNLGGLSLAFILGAALGGGLIWLVAKRLQPTPAAVAGKVSRSESHTASFDKASQEATVLKLNDRIKELEREIKNLKADNSPETLNKIISSPQPGSEKAAVVATQSQPAEQAATAVSARKVVDPPIRLYAPAPSAPRFEHRKLNPTPLPQLPICLTLAKPDASSGSFELSEYADQPRLIGDGIKELREFFEFKLPLPEYFTTIKSIRPGRLRRQGDEWVVDKKSNIELY